MVSDVLELMCGLGDTFPRLSTSPFTTIYLPPHDDTSHHLRDSKSSLGTTVVSKLGLTKLDLQPTSSVLFPRHSYIYICIYICIYINIPRTQMTLVLIGKGLVLGGLTFKNRGHLGSRYIYIIPGITPVTQERVDNNLDSEAHSRKGLRREAFPEMGESLCVEYWRKAHKMSKSRRIWQKIIRFRTFF